MAALGCLGLLITGQTGTLPFLTLIAVQTIAAILIVGRGASRQTHKIARRAIMREHPALTWRLIGLSLGLPLMFGLLAFYLLNTGFDVALVIFLGASYVSQIVVNLMLPPHIQTYLSSTFD